MIIRLVNFLCYIDKTFDLGDHGLTLISGPSGRGKTSILKGIFFALFGYGTKVQTHGKTSCRVELDVHDLKIIRTKRPNRLLVNDIHEDDEAQKIIDALFGNTFKISGYIQQNMAVNIISMNPSDKLKFLESFAFQDINLTRIKEVCKLYIKESNNKLIDAVSKLNMAKVIFNELEVPEKISFPIACKRQHRDKIAKNEKIRQKNCRIMIKRTEKIQKKQEIQLKDLNILQANLKGQWDIINNTMDKITKLLEKKSSIIYKGDNNLLELKGTLKELVGRRQLTILEKQYITDEKNLEMLVKHEEQERNNIILCLSKTLWTEYSRDDLKKIVHDIKQTIIDLERVKQLRDSMPKSKTTEEINICKYELQELCEKLVKIQHVYDILKEQKKTYNCPSCNTALRFEDNTLHIAGNVPKDEDNYDLNELKFQIDNIKMKIKNDQLKINQHEYALNSKMKIEDEITSILKKYTKKTDIKVFRDKLECLRRYEITQKQNEIKLKCLKKDKIEKKMSKTCSNVKTNVDSLCNRITEMQIDLEMDPEVFRFTEDQIRSEIFEQKQNKERINEIESQRQQLLLDQKRCEVSIKQYKDDYISKYDIIRDENTIKKCIETCVYKLQELYSDTETHQHNLKQIEKWNAYQIKLQNYNKWKKRINNLRENENTCKFKYAAALMLKNKILEAESIAIQNIIDSINTHARVFLDSFFTDDPIMVELQTFKESKKKGVKAKPSINIAVEYKGMECDIHTLSGGELSRVILAYTLSLSEIFNVPLILLDECTASLDQNLTSVVFDSIRQNFNDKLIVIIAHQVVCGTFDRIIDLA